VVQARRVCPVRGTDDQRRGSGALVQAGRQHPVPGVRPGLPLRTPGVDAVGDPLRHEDVGHLQGRADVLPRALSGREQDEALPELSSWSPRARAGSAARKRHRSAGAGRIRQRQRTAHDAVGLDDVAQDEADLAHHPGTPPRGSAGRRGCAPTHRATGCRVPVPEPRRWPPRRNARGRRLHRPDRRRREGPAGERGQVRPVVEGRPADRDACAGRLAARGRASGSRWCHLSASRRRGRPLGWRPPGASPPRVSAAPPPRGDRPCGPTGRAGRRSAGSSSRARAARAPRPAAR
jgi:hypothetical protein